MTIALIGGGSGGHITPILAVAEELKKTNPHVHLVYIGKKGDDLGDIPAASSLIDETYNIRAGKFRRYHGEGLKQLVDAPTILKNVRDFFYTLAGIWQSYRILGKLKPDVIFIKGGFVGLPVGLAAAMRHLPYVTHDSDTIPGLANRVIAKWASVHAVAMPAELYSYPPAKTKYVGVPITSDFKPVTDHMRHQYRVQLGLDNYHKIIFVTGGGLGAIRINNAVHDIAKQLLETYRDLAIVQIAGREHEHLVRNNYDQSLSVELASRITVLGFASDLYKYSGAADIIISRAGATNMAEWAAQHQACIVIPNPILTGGHQSKNAEHLEQAGAIRVVTEKELSKNPTALLPVVTELLTSDELRLRLSTKLGEYAKPTATHDLAGILLEVTQHAA